jgi:hypothetical protein
VSDRPLGDLLALALAERGPTSCLRLARTVAARDIDVRRALRDDRRFVHYGKTGGSRYRLADDTCEARLANALARIADLERRPSRHGRRPTSTRCST